MNKETFVSIMSKHKIEDSLAISEAYQAVKEALEMGRQIRTSCETRLLKQICKIAKDIQGGRIAFDTPFLLYKDKLKKKNRKDPGIHLSLFVEHIAMYAFLLEDKLAGWAHVKAIGNDVKVIPTNGYRKFKRMAGIASDIMGNCIYSDIQYDYQTGQFVAVADITDRDFFARHGIDCHFRAPDSRKAVFTGKLKKQKIKFDLSINQKEIFSGFEIDRSKGEEGKPIGQILRDSIIRFYARLNQQPLP